MASKAGQTVRRKGMTALLGCLVVAAGILAPAVAATRATNSYPLDPSLHLKRVRVPLLDVEQGPAGVTRADVQSRMADIRL